MRMLSYKPGAKPATLELRQGSDAKRVDKSKIVLVVSVNTELAVQA